SQGARGCHTPRPPRRSHRSCLPQPERSLRRPSLSRRREAWNSLPLLSHLLFSSPWASWSGSLFLGSARLHRSARQVLLLMRCFPPSELTPRALMRCKRSLLPQSAGRSDCFRTPWPGERRPLTTLLGESSRSVLQPSSSGRSISGSIPSFLTKVPSLHHLSSWSRS